MHIIKSKDITNKDFELGIIDWERVLLPEQNDEYIDIDGVDGQVHISKNLSNVQMRIQFFKENLNVTQWLEDKRNIVNWLRTKYETKFEFDDEPDVYYIGKVTETDIPERYHPDVTFWVTLTLHPFKYGVSVDKVISLTNNEYIEDNNGNYETPYIIKSIISGSGTKYTLTLNGDEIVYTGSLSDGDIITVDTNTLEFRVNGELKVLEVEGIFNLLEPGDNDIVIVNTGIHSISYVERSI